MKKYLYFIVGYFISLFATHNFGWEQTIKTGWMLLGMLVFFAIIFGVDNEEDSEKLNKEKKQ